MPERNRRNTGQNKRKEIALRGVMEIAHRRLLRKKAREMSIRSGGVLPALLRLPPTGSGYMSIIKHTCSDDKQIRLIATETGEELAHDYKQAQSAGLLGKLKDEESPGKKLDSSRGRPQVTGDINIRITITFPAIDLARFNIARRTSGSGEQESVLLNRVYFQMNCIP